MPEAGEAQHASQSHGLAHQLAPVLHDVCEGRLGDIRWFRSDWQRGGAATGYSTFKDDARSQEPLDVVIKLPVGPGEYKFTTGLAATDAPTPRIVAHGVELGGYDLAWFVMEKLPGSPLAEDRKKKSFEDLCKAAASFYKHALALGGPTEPQEPTDWDAIFERAREAVRDNDIPDAQRWNQSIKAAQRALPILLPTWRARSQTEWRHGDLHLGNAMMRPDDSPWGEPGCVLLDLAQIQAGHWVEDAVYMERIYWGHPEALCGAKPVKSIARARKSLGLPCDDDYARLANIRRVLIAAGVPAFLDREGHPSYLHGALEVLDRTLAQLN